MPLNDPGGVNTEAGAEDLANRRLTHLLHQAIQLDYVGTTNPKYVGWAPPGTATSIAAWRIAQLTFDVNNNPTQVLWAGGTIAYASIWDNRATLTYS